MTQIETLPHTIAVGEGEAAQNPLDAYEASRQALLDLPEQDTSTLTVRTHQGKRGNVYKMIESRVPGGDYQIVTTLGHTRTDADTALRMPLVRTEVMRTDGENQEYLLEVTYAPSPDGTVIGEVEPGDDLPTAADTAFMRDMGLDTALGVAEARRESQAYAPVSNEYSPQVNELAGLGTLHERAMGYASEATSS
jgi:hypothetical protein